MDQGDQLDHVLDRGVPRYVAGEHRAALDLLVFELEEEQLLLNAGKARWVNHASREVEIVLDQFRAAELLRAVKVEAAAEELGCLPIRAWVRCPRPPPNPGPRSSPTTVRRSSS